MPKISEVITSLFEIQAAIGDQEVQLVSADEAEIPMPDAPGLGVDVIYPPPIHGSNGHVTRE